MSITEPLYDKLPDGTDVTILPFNSADEAPEELVQTIQDLLNDAIEGGQTYPQLKVLDRKGFLAYYFPNFVAVMVEGKVKNSKEWDSAKNQFLGCFYIKPNYVGRSSHICNAGFLVLPNLRGRKIGKTLGKNYLKLAPRLGYKYSVFNLVFETNQASVKIWDSLGFDRIGRIPRAGNLKGLGYVDAIMFGYDFTKEQTK
ncbi:DEKNAAC104862 [Brettanomyces naardenensis]|uniref:DEKNAAC104862 n=1 Tax=Brettanomyces naardenensis TaxID=13370 RepID=A0A448YS56_BRENA|nr:DEKNAAC104862 [Brettanomyces naardenensis]